MFQPDHKPIGTRQRTATNQARIVRTFSIIRVTFGSQFRVLYIQCRLGIDELV